MSSVVACAHEAQKIFNPPFLSDFRNVSRAKATCGDNLPRCELVHDWTSKARRPLGGDETRGVSRCGTIPNSARPPGISRRDLILMFEKRAQKSKTGGGPLWTHQRGMWGPL